MDRRDQNDFFTDPIPVRPIGNIADELDNNFISSSFDMETQ